MSLRASRTGPIAGRITFKEGLTVEDDQIRLAIQEFLNKSSEEEYVDTEEALELFNFVLEKLNWCVCKRDIEGLYHAMNWVYLNRVDKIARYIKENDLDPEEVVFDDSWLLYGHTSRAISMVTGDSDPAAALLAHVLEEMKNE